MTEPALFADLVSPLNNDLREYFEERAAIREFDGDLPRNGAEAIALLDTSAAGRHFGRTSCRSIPATRFRPIRDRLDEH